MGRADDIDDVGVPAQRGWADDYRRLSAVDPAELAANDLEALADAAWMVCRLGESMSTRQQAYMRFLEAGENRPAARVAWRLFWDHLYGGESVVAMGWLRRARRHLENAPEDAEHGFLSLADAEFGVEPRVAG